MSNANLDKDLKWIFNLLLISCLIGASFIGLIIYSAATKSDVINDVRITEYGTVKSVSSCNKSKHSLKCRVVTDRYTFSNTDITDYPGDFVQVGDRIYLERRFYDDRVETWIGKNQTVRSRSVCHSWMPCFNKADN
ncbi:hypothetical protein VPFG_00271 [Vibrio phage nt-1]|uniref:Uncharacterized protein n=1 Tax=Vibrio phage nt-1 TaxID=115992 RepID=R9TIR1_9CAUD|nr:hypothetical protein VPFG_00271 [Vibrio phage nt-1]AGN30270.1 hypothetical protein VPFG_00271 [Vibrio phage nt-1]